MGSRLMIARFRLTIAVSRTEVRHGAFARRFARHLRDADRPGSDFGDIRRSTMPRKNW